MAATTGQRIFIWAMAIVMFVGTLGSFFIFMFEADNGPVSSPQEQQYEEIMKQQEEAAKARAESSQPLEGYKAEEFEGNNVSTLEAKVLKEGDGKEVASESTIKANYFGWTQDGKIFDSTRRDGKTEPVEFPLTGVIQGWSQGLAGKNVGDVVELTIPSDLAYGSTGSPPNIGPDEPLKFIVEIVEIVETEATEE